MADFPFPDERYYDRDQHMWVRVDDEGRLVVGIDVLGLESLGDLAYLTFGDVGVQARRGQGVGTLEAAKMTGDLVSPVSGTVVLRNEALLTNPALVNKDPYGAGWMLVIEPSDWQAEQDLLVYGEAVGPWVQGELQRYRDEGWID